MIWATNEERQGLNTLRKGCTAFSRAVEGPQDEALYQGTTLVGPFKPGKDEGFSP